MASIVTDAKTHVSFDPDALLKKKKTQRHEASLPASHGKRRGSEWGHEHLEEFGEWNVETMNKDDNFQRADGTIVRSKQSRKVDWSELFYDLVYVAIIADLTHELAAEPSWRALLWYLIVFCNIWAAWRDCTTYLDWFIAKDLVNKAFLFIHMFLAVVLGATHPHPAGVSGGAVGASWQFAVAAALLKVVMLCMFGIVYFFIKPVRQLLFLANVGNILVAVVYVIAALTVDDAARTVLWLLAVVIDLLGWMIPILVLRTTSWGETQVMIPFNIEHITERFGLFTILVLGEVVASAAFVGDFNTSYRPFLAAFFALIIAFSVQQVYFDLGNTLSTFHALRWSWQSGLLWFIAHLPFSVSTALVGGGFGYLIHAFVFEDAGGDDHGGSSGHRRKRLVLAGGGGTGGGDVGAGEKSAEAARWMVGAGVGVLLLLLTLLSILHKAEKGTYIARKWRLIIRFLSGVACCALPSLHYAIPNDDLVWVGIIACICTIDSLMEAYGARTLKRELQGNNAAAAVNLDRRRSPHAIDDVDHRPSFSVGPDDDDGNDAMLAVRAAVGLERGVGGEGGGGGGVRRRVRQARERDHNADLAAAAAAAAAAANLGNLPPPHFEGNHRFGGNIGVAAASVKNIGVGVQRQVAEIRAQEEKSRYRRTKKRLTKRIPLA